jgi:hypothetical protein
MLLVEQAAVWLSLFSHAHSLQYLLTLVVDGAGSGG